METALKLLGYLGGGIFLIIISYLTSAGILELAKEDFKKIHITALIIFVILIGIINYN